MKTKIQYLIIITAMAFVFGCDRESPEGSNKDNYMNEYAGRLNDIVVKIPNKLDDGDISNDIDKIIKCINYIESNKILELTPIVKVWQFDGSIHSGGVENVHENLNTDDLNVILQWAKKHKLEILMQTINDIIMKNGKNENIETRYCDEREDENIEQKIVDDIRSYISAQQGVAPEPVMRQ